MKTEYYGSYILQIEDSYVRLHYKRTLKDYWDILMKILILLLAGLQFLFTIPKLLSSITNLSANIFALLIASFLGYWIYINSKQLILLLTIPRKNLIHLEKEGGILRVKSSTKKKFILFQEDLIRLEYELTENIQKIKSDTITKYTVPVFARTKDRKNNPLFIINEPSLPAWEDSIRKEELLQLAQDLTRRLAQLLNATAKYKGIATEKLYAQ